MGNYQEDEQLLAQMKAGDDAVLQSFYRTMKAPFQAFIRKKANYNLSAEGMEDIYTDAFVVFWQKVQDGALTTPLKSKLKTYLFGIGVYKLLTYGDKQQRGLEAKVDDVEVQSLDLTVELVGLYKEEREALQHSLDLLDEPCRDLLKLIYFKNYATEAIATRLGYKNEGAIRQRKRRCLQKLRELMN